MPEDYDCDDDCDDAEWEDISSDEDSGDYEQYENSDTGPEMPEDYDCDDECDDADDLNGQ